MAEMCPVRLEWGGAELVRVPGPAVRAGFPSPAGDYVEERLDISRLVVRDPSATFYFRMQGEAMTGAGIFPGDILVVDRSLPAAPGRVVVAVVAEEMLVRRLEASPGGVRLAAEGAGGVSLPVPPDAVLEIWGVVTYVLHRP